MRIGVLALQGGFAEHVSHLKKASALLVDEAWDVVEVMLWGCGYILEVLVEAALLASVGLGLGRMCGPSMSYESIKVLVYLPGLGRLLSG